MQKIDYGIANKYAHQLEAYVTSHFNNAIEYDATPFVLAEIQKLTDDFFAYPLRDGLLGTTLVDSAVTVTISDKIAYGPRRYFTCAHELCHVLIDKEYIRTHPGIDVEDENGLPSSKDNPKERRANHFAALVLLPDEILNAVMMERKSKFYIRHHQKVSFETLKYRISDFIQLRFLLPRSMALKIAAAFADKEADPSQQKGIYGFWRAAEDRNISLLTRDRIIKKNNDLAHGLINPMIFEDRKRKKRVREQNKLAMKVLDDLYQPDDKTGFYMLADNFTPYLDEELDQRDSAK
ncbi:hypothetical protein FAM18108_01037 [Lacticaseibacillus paracasei]|uniref:ImmA/IrrE family metallo-endopeptidase n=1 Tax=Lacticaseibacillus paracasei TaxID=1597 RepID=UPI000F0B2888|nr:ImmA/IrrE family metallo-endopeptidase [Lacticaseibacillus paracasei]RND47841.1 hypothetical protein FAM18108_01037 [Lacticaseibacillus paracasei]